MKKSHVLNLFFYGGVALYAIWFFYFGIFGGEFQWDLPVIYDADILFTTVVFKAIAQGTTGLYNVFTQPQAGAPFAMVLGDFPSIDWLFFTCIKIFSWFTKDPIVLYNLLYFCSFPLASVFFLRIARRLQIHPWLCFPFAIAFSFLTFHQLRYGHLFLSCYFFLPLYLETLLDLWEKKPLGTRSQKAKWIFIAFLAGSSGIYYAFFFCFFLAFVSLDASLQYRSKRHVYSGCIMIAMVAFWVMIGILPNILYRAHEGPNPQMTERLVFDSEIYSLKLSQMLLPRWNSPIKYFRILRNARYQSASYPAEGFNESIDTLAMIGSFLLIGFCFFYARREKHLKHLAQLWLTGFLLATFGGFGVFVAMFITPNIRCYNRMSPFLALFGLLAFAYVLQKGIQRYVAPQRQKVTIAVLALFLLGFTTFEQGVLLRRGAQREIEPNYFSDKNFIGLLEEMLPEGASVLQLPYVPFPEYPPIHQMLDFSHLRAPLHAKSLRFSYGAMKGRLWAEQIRVLSENPLDMERLRNFGYQAVYIDRFAYLDRAGALEAAIMRVLNQRPIVSSNGRLSAFILGPPS